MSVKIMPRELLARLLEGETDILTELAKKRTSFVNSMRCPRCSGPMREETQTDRAFRPDDPLARVLARCLDCGCSIDPTNGIVVDNGNPGQIRSSLPLIKPED